MEKKKEELQDEYLENVNGGHGTTMHKTCPFCNRTFSIDGMYRYKEGEYITSCYNGHKVYYSASGYNVHDDAGNVIKIT